MFICIGGHLKSRQRVLIIDRGANTWNIQMNIVSCVLTALLLSAICEVPRSKFKEFVQTMHLVYG